MGNFRKKAKSYIKKQARRAWQGAKKRYTGKQGIANIVKDISMLKTALNTEKKYYNVASTPGSGNLVAANAYIYSPFDAMAQGLAEDQRLGIQVKALWSSMRLHFELNGNTGTTVQRSTMLRIIAFMDLEPRGEGVQPALTMRNNLLSSIANPRDVILSYYRTDGFVGDRYKILRDFRIRLDDVGQRQKIVNLNFNFTKMRPKTKGLRVKYDAANELNDDRLYILVLSDDASVAGSGFVDFTTQIRTCYVDN